MAVVMYEELKKLLDINREYLEYDDVISIDYLILLFEKRHSLSSEGIELNLGERRLCFFSKSHKVNLHFNKKGVLKKLEFTPKGWLVDSKMALENIS